MHLHKAFRAEFVTSPLIAAFGRAQLSVSPLPPHGDRGVRYCIAGIPTRSVVSQNPHLTVGPLWRASLWGLWTSNRVEFEPNVIIE